MAEAFPLFAVLSARVHDVPYPQDSGDLLLARFNVEYGPLLIVGAQLLSNRHGSFYVRLPAGGRTRRIVARTKPVCDQLLNVVMTAYHAAGGRPPAALPLAKASSTYEATS